ncbi:MAG: aminotransferase class I/II-fold pyridoxal phosphate-dependent enzyme [Candidatus Promineifilaceae bacterium]
MYIEPFAIEQYFALYEFNTRFLLCASDCETMSAGELVALAGQSLKDMAALPLGYTESQGDPELRAAIATTYNGRAPREVVVLGSPEEGIYLAMRALLEPGDHVIVLTPAYDSLLNLARHVSGNVSEWPIRAVEGAWQLDIDQLSDLITDNTKLIVINFPHNPTGFLPSAEQLSEIAAVAARHNAWLFCDEMYRGLELGGRSTLPSAVDLYERAVVLAGLSKVYGLPGLRAGWLVVRDAALREAIINWKFYTSICPAAPTEFLAKAALSARAELITRNRRLIEQNVAVAEPFFERWLDMFVWRPPQAGSIALVGLNHPSATAYCHRLAQEAGVLLLPSSCLGYGDGHVRMGFGRADFEQGLAHYESFLLQDDL